MTSSTRLTLCAILCALTGCSGPTTSPFARLTPAKASAMAQWKAAAREQELRDDLRTARPPHDVLLLSGGDAGGAFGCGVLAGWRQAPGGRPTFDVVTGVSTGALMAVGAFLGSDADDAALRSFYTKIRDEDVFGRPLVPPAHLDGLLDTAPLRKLIHTYVTPALLQRVAAAHREGRRLYVATVDLDAGTMVIWPLSRIADRACTTPNGTHDHVDPAGLERFRKVLLASAAIPVAFPPVEIDGDLHVDAGIRAALFLRDAMLGPASVSRSANDPPPTVYAILNSRLHADPTGTPDDLLHIGARSMQLLIRATQLASLRDAAYVTAHHTPAGTGDAQWRFRYVHIPDGWDANDTRLMKPMFEPKKMRDLYTLGLAAGQSPDAPYTPWRDGPPPPDEDVTASPN